MTSVSSPIKSLSAHATIDGIPTTVTTQAYQDKILILVSQLGRIGSLTQATLPATIPLLPAPLSSNPLPPLPPNLPTPHPSTILLPLMGTAPTQELQPVYEMYVNQLAAIVWNDEGTEGSRRPVVVGMALKWAKRSGEGQGEREGEGEGEGWKKERERFARVVGMVGGCRVW